jgi:rhodanese-related sulfurtransferase
MLIISILFSTLYALKVNITKDIPFVDVDINGENIKIQRIQDTKHKLKNSYTKTSRPTPPFNIQPFTPIKGVKTVTELDVIEFIKDDLSENSALLIDARMPKWYNHSTIPGALNIPFTIFSNKDAHIIEQIFEIFDITKTEDGWDFSDAQTLLIFDNGPWCQQAVMALKQLIKLGYPKERLLYYRGGMQYWQIVGLTTIKPKSQ